MKRLLPLFFLLLSSVPTFSQVRLEWISDTLYQETQQRFPRFILHGLSPGKQLNWVAQVGEVYSSPCIIGSPLLLGFPRPAPEFENGDTGFFFPSDHRVTDLWREGRVNLTISIGDSATLHNLEYYLIPSAFYFKRTKPYPTPTIHVTPREFVTGDPIFMEVAAPTSSSLNTSVRLQVSVQDSTYRDRDSVILRDGGFPTEATSQRSGVAKFSDGLSRGTYSLFVSIDTVCQVFPDGLRVLPRSAASPGRIEGTVYADRSRNCQLDTADKAVGTGLVQAADSMGNHYYGLSDVEGKYAIIVPNGRYTVRLVNRFGVPAHPCAGTQTAMVSMTQPLAPLSPMLDSALPRDVQAYAMSYALRPGKESAVFAGVMNQGDYDLTSRIVLEYDTLLRYVPLPGAPFRIDSTIGNRIYFKTQTARGYGFWSEQVRFSVPPDGGLIGRTVRFKVRRMGASDADPTNDTATFFWPIFGSHDPNDKQVSPESRRPGVEGDLTYTIRFQNTGTDTAFYVSVSDTLSPLLDLSTLHGFVSTHKAEYKLTGRVLEARFPFINLVDSNRNEPASHGQFSFNIRPVAGLALGQQIENKADIYFDYNAPVRTNTAVFRVQQPTAIVAAKQEVLQWIPNPATDRAELRMTAVPVGILLAVNVAGKTHTMTCERTETGIRLSLTTLTPGVYSFRFEGGAAVGRLVVAK